MISLIVMMLLFWHYQKLSQLGVIIDNKLNWKDHIS